MKIIVHLANHAPTDLTALQIFDFYFAYMQSQNRKNKYDADLEIKIGSNIDIDPCAINIGFYNMPQEPVECDKFDFVIVDGNQHSLEICTEEMYRAFVKHENCYLLTGAFVDKNYPRADRIITFPFFIMTRDWFTRPFYPQFYERESPEQHTKKNFVFNNGQNRPHRQFMIDLLETKCHDLITIKKNPFQNNTKLLDSFFETPLDTKFREHVNSYCPVMDDLDQIEKNYFNHSVWIGIDKRFGSIPPGYFIIDEYWNYRCVIYPETTWLNNEVFVTEKISKSAITKNIPWPIGGANIDVLYNKIGFQTAWNLLPEQLQLYNYEEDHIKRYNMCAEAIRWLANHPEILTSARAQDLVEHNYNFFFSNTLEAMAPKKLNEIIQRYKK